MRRLAVLLLASFLGLAGCFDSADEPAVAPAAESAGVTLDEARPEPTFGDVALGPAAAPDANATLRAAPRLVPGEWWRIQMTSPLDGRSAEYVRVVAAVDGDQYVIGMPHEGWYKEAVIYHVPFFGDVSVEDLSGHAHDIHFQPLQFPLTDDTTWETRFEGPPDLVATVKTDASAQTADVTFTDEDGNVHVTLTYDAKVHEITKFSHAIIDYEVVEHGYGFEGWVTIPRGEDLVFFHGRFGGVIGFSPDGNGVAPSPQELVEVAGGFNRMSFILAILPGSLTPAPLPSLLGTPSAQGIRATDPAGNVYELSAMPYTDSGVVIEFFEATEPDGTWTIDYTSAGSGGVLIEGIAYHQYDIRLPSGERRADHSHDVIR